MSSNRSEADLVPSRQPLPRGSRTADWVNMDVHMVNDCINDFDLEHLSPEIKKENPLSVCCAAIAANESNQQQPVTRLLKSLPKPLNKTAPLLPISGSVLSNSSGVGVKGDVKTPVNIAVPPSPCYTVPPSPCFSNATNSIPPSPVDEKNIMEDISWLTQSMPSLPSFPSLGSFNNSNLSPSMETNLNEAVDVLISSSPEFVKNFGKYLVSGVETGKEAISLPSPPPSPDSNDDEDDSMTDDEEIDEKPSLDMLPKVPTTIKRSLSCNSDESDYIKPTGRGSKSKKSKIADEELVCSILFLHLFIKLPLCSVLFLYLILIIPPLPPVVAFFSVPIYNYPTSVAFYFSTY